MMLPLHTPGPPSRCCRQRAGTIIVTLFIAEAANVSAVEPAALIPA